VSENTRIALISASAAIVGALAGGLATYITTQQSEKAQDQREERRVDDEAAGVARRMIVEFRQAVFLSQSLATRGARTPRALVFAGRVGFPLEASAEELGLLYSRLRRREFKAVADGLNIADLIGAELREPVEKAALPGVKQDAATWIEYLVDAREALRRVARTGSELHR
jgi:hypothetical protein